MQDESYTGARGSNLQDSYAAADLQKLGYKQELTRVRRNLTRELSLSSAGASLGDCSISYSVRMRIHIVENA
jgi:hypothetical protein